MEKNERIEKKRAELLGVFAKLSDDQQVVAADLIHQAAFLAVELEDLAEDIKESGPTEIYTNGANQTGRKVSSSAKLYGSLISKYATITSKLLSLIPAEREAKEEKPERYDPARDPARLAAQREFAEQKIKEHEYFAALSAGKIQQEDYRAFMNGDIEL